MDTSDLAKRMKDYESISKTRLMKRCPVLCRIDGKAHHSFTRGFQKPFDEIYMKTMQETTKYLCENLQGVVIGYTQSDEITLVFVDYNKLDTSPYFDYEVQKLCSIIASMTTMIFNKLFAKHVENFMQNCVVEYETQGLCGEGTVEYELCKTYQKAMKKGAMFDARVFNLPKEEVTNCLYWRQLDATRNSIQMVGQAYFSQKELHCKTCNDIQDMLVLQKNINWNNFPAYQKRGTCVIKKEFEQYEDVNDSKKDENNSEKKRAHWVIDTDIPLFKGDGRQYIENLVMVGE